MDLRLLDEVVQFMDHDGLSNRYDHVILAGAALGGLGGGSKKYRHWKKTFFNHLKIAHQLHHIKDVYIIEHRDCGAYREFLGDKGTFTDCEAGKERKCHCKYAKKLARKIKDWAKENDLKLGVRAFLMDLRGEVSQLFPKC